jgi:hypothetical protein
MPDALRIKLSKEEIESIQNAADFNPLFPTNFLFNFKGDQKYNLTLTAAHNQQYQMAAWIDAPPKQLVSARSCPLLRPSILTFGQPYEPRVESEQ